MKESIVEHVRQALKDSSNANYKASSQRFFKEGEAPNVYGVRSADLRRIAKESLKDVKRYSKAEVFQLCESLWQSDYFEESIIACIWAESLEKQFTPDDFDVFERWIHQYIRNWADCDTFCNHTVGSFLMKYPEYLKELKRWATSDNRWVRRASVVSLIIPARKGLFLKDVFELAEILLLDNDDLVQKGYGWLLKVAAEKHQEAVFDYVMSKKEVMPRTALRYAIEKMPADLKAAAMRKSV